ncbi:MAG: ribosome silencing factor [Actinomycetota bacterium]|nr:ribosome silencing factor [Actinomycetota bacterium]
MTVAMSQYETLSAVQTARGAIDDKKGEDLILLDISEITPVADYFLIATGSNSRQIRTLSEEVERAVKEKFGVGPLSIEGLAQAQWVLMDYGDFVVHIFDQETRDFFNLERLWSDAKRVS